MGHTNIKTNAMLHKNCIQLGVIGHEIFVNLSKKTWMATLGKNLRVYFVPSRPCKSVMTYKEMISNQTFRTAQYFDMSIYYSFALRSSRFSFSTYGCYVAASDSAKQFQRKLENIKLHWRFGSDVENYREYKREIYSW